MALLLASFVVLVGLAPSASPATTTTTTTASTTSSAAPTTTTTSAAPLTVLLQSVGVFDQAGYDQVVFQFADALPRYTVQVVSRPLEADPSGKAITVAGDVVVQVR